MKILFLTAPMVQINTPYPATAYLTGYFSQKNNLTVWQKDPALELVLKIFSHDGLKKILDQIQTTAEQEGLLDAPEIIIHALAKKAEYLNTIEPIIRFLQGKDPSYAHRIASRKFLPEGPRFSSLQNAEVIQWAFGDLGLADQAKHIASLYLDDLADLVQIGIDPLFSFSRYGERLAASNASFLPLENELNRSPTLLDNWLEEIITSYLNDKPDLIGISVPFSGTVYAAFRIAKAIRKYSPETKILLGGGYVNTELRSLTEPKVFDYFDFITYDDGERPIECILEYLAGKRTKEKLFRTRIREKNSVIYINDPSEKDIPFSEIGTPTYRGLPLDKYISMLEMLNPVNRLWSDLRWNKLTLAHGCYWNKCSFCDTSLDYIQRYESADISAILMRMMTLANETSFSGFHFVDEAAPPALLKKLSQAILNENFSPSWWGNIRFEKSFQPDLTDLMANAGCIAVTGGLEVASPRILKLINKGVTIEQVAQVTRNFQRSGIFVHAYLMYGFPSQTAQETIDSLEVVRQLFAEGCLQSAFWHRFAATVHSPVGKNPKKFGIEILPTPSGPRFAENDLHFVDPSGVDHDKLGEGLRLALYNYMLGVGLKTDVREWFSGKVPKTTLPKTLIKKALQNA